MNNYELHSRAHELAASHSGYNLARRLLALEEELQEARREFGEFHQSGGEVTINDMRKAFEQEFPVPSGVIWAGDMYGSSSMATALSGCASYHTMKFEAWCKALEWQSQQAQGEVVAWISEDDLRRVQKGGLCYADVAGEKTRFRAIPLYSNPPAPAAVPKKGTPKPGKPVLARYFNELGKQRIIKAVFLPEFYWEQDPDCDWVGDYSEENDQYYWPKGWYECVENWDEISHISVDHQIVDWLPIPDFGASPAPADPK